MARTKTNTRDDTKTLTTSWRNRHLENIYFCVFRIRTDCLPSSGFCALSSINYIITTKNVCRIRWVSNLWPSENESSVLSTAIYWGSLIKSDFWYDYTTVFWGDSWTSPRRQGRSITDKSNLKYAIIFMKNISGQKLYKLQYTSKLTRFSKEQCCRQNSQLNDTIKTLFH